MSQEHQFAREDLESLFAQAKKKQKIIDAISRPAERTLTWERYRKIFVTSSRIKKGVTFWKENPIPVANPNPTPATPATTPNFFKPLTKFASKVLKNDI